MMLDKTTLKDIFHWRVKSWSQVLTHWNSFLPDDISNKKVLELGAYNGGLSLYFSLLGAKSVCCSDIFLENLNIAKKIHSRYNLKNIYYEEIDALQLNEKYIDYFDVITFKSVVGSVSRNKNDQNKIVFF